VVVGLGELEVSAGRAVGPDWPAKAAGDVGDGSEQAGRPGRDGGGVNASWYNDLLTKKNIACRIADDLDRTELETKLIVQKTLEAIMFTRFKLPLLFVCLVPTCQTLHARTVRFSDATWTVKTIAGKAGPGPNYFSNSPNMNGISIRKGSQWAAVPKELPAT
jgi:hypothetical protein